MRRASRGLFAGEYLWNVWQFRIFIIPRPYPVVKSFLLDFFSWAEYNVGAALPLVFDGREVTLMELLAIHFALNVAASVLGSYIFYRFFR